MGERLLVGDRRVVIVGDDNAASSFERYVVAGPFPAGGVFVEMTFRTFSNVSKVRTRWGVVVQLTDSATGGAYRAGHGLIQSARRNDVGHPSLYDTSSGGGMAPTVFPLWVPVLAGPVWLNLFWISEQNLQCDMTASFVWQRLALFDDVSRKRNLEGGDGVPPGALGPG